MGGVFGKLHFDRLADQDFHTLLARMSDAQSHRGRDVSALYVGTWVWHELTDFTPDAAILVIASTLYEDAEYLRDYEAFKHEAVSRS